MLNIQLIKNEIIAKQQENIFNYLNKKNKGIFSSIRDLIVKEQLVKIPESKQSRKHIEYLLTVINEALERGDKILVPMMQNILFCSNIVYLEKNISIKEAISYGISNEEYMGVTKENFHIYENDLIDFLKLSLSFRKEILFPTKNLENNSFFKRVLKNQINFILDEIIEIKEENDVDINQIKEYQKNLNELMNENILLKDKISFLYKINEQKIYFPMIQKDLTTLIKKGLNDEERNLISSYTNQLDIVGFEHEKHSLLNNIDERTLCLIYLSEQDKNKNLMEQDEITLSELITESKNPWLTNFIYDLPKMLYEKKYDNSNYNTFMYEFELITRELKSKIFDEKKPKDTIEYLEKNKEKLKKFLMNLNDDELKENINDLARQREIFEMIKEDLVNIDSVKSLLNKSLIIDDNLLLIDEPYCKIVYKNGYAFFKNFHNRFIDSNILEIEVPVRDKGIFFIKKDNSISMEDFSSSVYALMSYVNSLDKSNHQVAGVKIEQFWQEQEHELRLKSQLMNKEEQISKNRRKV